MSLRTFVPSAIKKGFWRLLTVPQRYRQRCVAEQKADWYNLRNAKPISNVWGVDRGQAVDRYYIEKFLDTNRSLITGDILEVADDTYSRRFGAHVTHYGILHAAPGNPLATLVADLSKPDTLPAAAFDCFICTQTYNFIYDFKSAIISSYKLLRNGGTLLATVAGVSQIARDDDQLWGDYWRFTTRSMQMSFGEVFGGANVQVESYGNVLTAVAFLEGISKAEVAQEVLDYHDPMYQVIITIKARKPLLENR